MKHFNASGAGVFFRNTDTSGNSDNSNNSENRSKNISESSTENSSENNTSENSDTILSKHAHHVVNIEITSKFV